MNILISGINGFVGSNLSAYLSNKGYEISSLSRTPSSIKGYVNFTWDNLSEIKDSPTDVIVHLAGKAHDLKNTSNPQEYYDINFELTKKIYDAFLRSDAKKFIFISSVKAAADVVNDVLTEESIPNPQTHYGKSKLMAEEYIQKQLLPEGKSYYILRPCMIHGPGNKGNLNLLYQLVSKGIPYPLGSFENKRSFLSVGNFCYIIEQLIAKEQVLSGVYNVADDQALSTKMVVELLYLASHKKPKIIHIAPRIVIWLAKIGDRLRLPFNSERLQKLTENYRVSNQKIKTSLQTDFPITAIEGLNITAKSFNL